MARSHVAEAPVNSTKDISSFLEFVVKAPALEEYRDKKVFIARNVPFDDAEVDSDLCKKGIAENPNPIRCLEIFAIPHHREKGLYLISKEEVSDISNNHELLARSSQPDDPRISKMTDDEVINYLPVSPGRRRHGKSQLHPATDPDVGVMEGINTSQFYIAGVNTLSEIHLENALLPSTNLGVKRLFVASADGYMKVWLILPDRERFERVIYDIQKRDRVEALTRQSSGRELSSEENTDSPETFIFAGVCPNELSHKYIYVDTPFLIGHGVPYETFRQGPHDLVYTKEGVYHEVGQLAANIAEAANFAEPSFNVYALHVPVDLCGKSQLAFIRPNRHQVTTVKTRSRRLHDCDDCDFSTPNMQKLRQHAKAAHKKTIPKVQDRVSRICSVCGAKTRKMSDHVKNSKTHEAALLKLQKSGCDLTEDPIPIWRCRFCSDDYSDESDRRAHEDECGKDIPTTSSLRGPYIPADGSLSLWFECDYCGRTYKQRFYLEAHIQRCRLRDDLQ
ncbi:hypothetical protein QAD02_002626 [Eretmocerus hayati]|uniref:Uncharacterized protein n=1 Tax=Eretmocerus hayati TaxID=131215 RepID=A0ACC2NMB0_9HYME|nr:hypothetical protein QAD02_002626 [Eretmocerus hayati]